MKSLRFPVIPYAPRPIGQKTHAAFDGDGVAPLELVFWAPDWPMSPPSRPHQGTPHLRSCGSHPQRGKPQQQQHPSQVQSRQVKSPVRRQAALWLAPCLSTNLTGQRGLCSTSAGGGPGEIWECGPRFLRLEGVELHACAVQVQDAHGRQDAEGDEGQDEGCHHQSPRQAQGYVCHGLVAL